METKILITGPEGYIGKKLIQVLKTSQERYEIIPWNREFGPITNEKIFKSVLYKFRPDKVVLSAWQSTAGLDYEKNENHLLWPSITKMHIETCLKLQSKVIVFGSVVDSNLLPKDKNTDYIKSKIELRKIVDEKLPNDKLIYVRLHYVLDELSKKPRLFSDISESISRGEEFRPKDTESLKNYIHINDVISALLKLLEFDMNGVVDICSEYERNTYSLASCLYKKSGIFYPDITKAFTRKSLPKSSTLQLMKYGWAPNETNAFFKDSEFKHTKFE